MLVFRLRAMLFGRQEMNITSPRRPDTQGETFNFCKVINVSSRRRTDTFGRALGRAGGQLCIAQGPKVTCVGQDQHRFIRVYKGIYTLD